MKPTNDPRITDTETLFALLDWELECEDLYLKGSAQYQIASYRL